MSSSLFNRPKKPPCPEDTSGRFPSTHLHRCIRRANAPGRECSDGGLEAACFEQALRFSLAHATFSAFTAARRRKDRRLDLGDALENRAVNKVVNPRSDGFWRMRNL